jgi:nucleoside-diphosphate-sugar epimerase/sugar phosphate isomerase/epimerase
MSTGSAAIPLLKAAPEPEQIADRLADGPWRGLELCLGPGHVSDDEAVGRAISVCEERLGSLDLALTAEAPVAWPSRAFVRVDRLDDEARAGIERSAEFARAVGSPVLTIHLFIPLDPDSFRAADPVDEPAVEEFLRFYADAALRRGVTPLIENVPPVLRMRTGGVFFSRIGGHWRDLRAWRQRIPELGFTIDVSHAALFRSFAVAYPALFGVVSGEELELERFVKELGGAAQVAHVSDALGMLGEGLPYGTGELELDPVVRRLGELVPYIVAEINEPDPVRSADMKKAYAAIERALATPASPAPASKRAAKPGFDWQGVLGRRDPVPSVLELQEVFGGRRILITGGGGSIARALATFLVGFRPERVVLLDSHEPSLAADRRARGGGELAILTHVLGDVRDAERIEARLRAERPDILFHFAAYKHVDWAETFREEFVDTNLQGSWNVLRAAEAAEVDTVVVASTDKAALAASFYGRTKRFMEQLAAFAARRATSKRIAIRFVNVLGSAGSASQLFLEQARNGIPLTVTDSGMVRYWIAMGHAVCLAAHGVLLAAEGSLLAVPADPVTMTVGELGSRIWRQAGNEGEPKIDLLGIRRGETMTEVLTGPDELLGAERYQGIAPILAEIPTAAPVWVAERLPEAGDRPAAARAVWLEAISRPGLLQPDPRAGARRARD